MDSESPPSSAENDNNQNSDNEMFSCNICFEQAVEPVITMCGHLFCWPCIFQWLRNQADRSCPCPVCKSVISKEKLIPLYGRGKEQKDPRTKTEIPERPAGQRTEAPPQSNFRNFQHIHGHPFQNDFMMGAGFGFFPSLFAPVFGFQFQFGPGANNAAQTQTREQLDNLYLSRLLLFVGFLLIFCLIMF